MSEDRDYTLMTAVDVLDAVAAGEEQPMPALLRGALVLALSSTAADEAALDVVRDLERLISGATELDGVGRFRAGAMASALRRNIGVH